MYNPCDITPKKRPEQNGLHFASNGSTRSTLISSSSGGRQSENEEGDKQNARNNNNVVNGKISDVAFPRFLVNPETSRRKLDGSDSSPLRTLVSSSSSDSHCTPDRSKTDSSSGLDPKRLGFSWLQSNQLNAGEVIRSTPRKSSQNGGVVLNPFENDLIETMQMSSCSPSVFLKVVTPSKVENESEAFNWGVENAALLYPQEFDNIHSQTASMVDQEMEEKVQSAINTYFSQKVVVPSPWIGNDEHRSPTHSDRWPRADKSNVWCQTALSIPPHVDLSSILSGYMQFREQESCSSPVYELSPEERDMLSLSNPRRKLFLDGEFGDESMAMTADTERSISVVVEPDDTSLEKNKNIIPFSPDAFSCEEADERRGLNFQRATSVSPPKHIKTPTDSPIRLYQADVSMENKSALQLSRSMLNEHDEDEFSFESECLNTSSEGVATLSKDTGYHTEHRKLAQGSSSALAGDCSWSPLTFSTPSKHTPSPT